MSDEKTRQSTLDQLKEMSETDAISEVRFSEPELKEFDTANIFELDVQPAPRKKFGKRSERRASQVKIRNYDEDFDDKQPRPVLSRTESKAAAVSEPAAAAPQEDTRPEEKPVIQPVEEDNQVEDVEIRPVQEEDLFMGKTTKLDASDLSKAMEQEEEAGGDTIIMPAPVHSESILVEQTGPHTEQIERSPEPVIEETFEEDITFHVEPEKSSENSLYLNPNEETEDIYMDKNRTAMSNYPKIEEYLAEQSAQGFHYIRQDGKKYYFVQGNPENYYYAYTYFKDEPSEELLDRLRRAGWVEVSRFPGKRRKDAGWIVFRNFQEPDTQKQEIDNDEEKLRYFKKQASSYRSTMFLVFICMVCCCITAWLQFSYNGLWAILIACAILFVICLIVFLVYARYLRNARKRAKLLRSRLRKRKNQQASAYPVETDTQLEEDWESLEPQKNRKTRKK